MLAQEHKFKLKGTGKGTGNIAFHLGCDFFHDDYGVLCMAPVKYIKNMIANYERMFGEKPKTLFSSLLEKRDYPELDTFKFLDSKGVQDYQSITGSLQWAISLGRLDIAMAVMLLSSFRALPHKDHLD